MLDQNLNIRLNDIEAQLKKIQAVNQIPVYPLWDLSFKNGNTAAVIYGPGPFWVYHLGRKLFPNKILSVFKDYLTGTNTMQRIFMACPELDPLKCYVISSKHTPATILTALDLGRHFDVTNVIKLIDHPLAVQLQLKLFDDIS